MLGLVILGALVSLNLKVLLTKRYLTVVAFERQKVDEHAMDMRTLLPYAKQLGTVLRG